MTLKIRTATTSDLEAVVTLINSAYRGDYSKQGWTTEADILGGQRTDVDSLRDLIQEESQRIELLFDGDRLIGSVFVKFEDASVYFGMLTVEPTLQNRGFAKKLLHHVEELARQLKKKFVKLTVIDLRLELIAYYERLGFKATGEVEPFPEHDPRYGIPKTKLRLLVYQKDL